MIGLSRIDHLVALLADLALLFPAALFNSIPFIGFGFLDNVIMITAVSTVFFFYFVYI